MFYRAPSLAVKHQRWQSFANAFNADSSFMRPVSMLSDMCAVSFIKNAVAKKRNNKLFTQRESKQIASVRTMKGHTHMPRHNELFNGIEKA